MSFASQSRDRAAPTLPMTSMVDILFLLLIFFMTASVFRDAEMSMDVNLPTSETASSAVGPGTQIVITVDAENRVFLGEREVPMDRLMGVLQDLVEVAPNDSVVIRADHMSNTGVAVRAMDLAQQAGLASVSIATIRPATE